MLTDSKAQSAKLDEACGCAADACNAEPFLAGATAASGRLARFSSTLFLGFGLVLGIVVLVALLGEWLGLLDRLSDLIPWPVWAVIVLAGGLPIFRDVGRAALRRKVTSHTLMTVGLIAAVAVGQWPAAVLVVFFMRLADYVERYTSSRARQAVRELTAMAPERARIERDGREIELPLTEVRVGDVVVVRPGENIPVDGEVVGGHAAVNQAAVTGEAMPVEAGPGARVFAASFAQSRAFARAGNRRRPGQHFWPRDPPRRRGGAAPRRRTAGR